MQANDLVLLEIGLPVLTISFWMAMRGSLQGRMLLTGTLGFILYTYIAMCFGVAFNQHFLVYVALFSLSLFAFILGVMSFDLKTLSANFTKKLPHRSVAALLFFAAAFLLLAWLGRIISALSQDQIPQLENVTSMFIQAMDLAIIVPVCVLSAIRLLRNSAWGYLLASIGMTKFLTMGVAVSLMGLNMARLGVPVSVVGMVLSISITLLNAIMVILLLKNSGPERTPAVFY
jgi:hypothetical protein